MFKFIWHYMKRYKPALFFVFLFSMLQVLCQLILPQMMDEIIKKGVGRQDMNYVYYAGGRMLLMTILVSGCMIACGYFSAYVTAKFTCDIREDLFIKARDFATADYNHFGGATLMTRSTVDVTLMQIMMINSLRSTLIVPFTGIGALIVAIRLNGELTVVVMTAFILCTIFLVFCARKSNPLFKELQVKTDRINLLMKEKLTGVRNIRAFNRQQSEIKKLEEADEQAYESAVQANRAINYMTPAMQLVMNLTLVVIYYLSAVKIQNAMMDSADLLKFLQYILNFIASLTAIVGIINFIPKASVSAARVQEVLDYETTVKNALKAEQAEERRGELEFKQVAFCYAGAEENVVREISFRAVPGTTTALIGATGSGKTTLVSLALRLFDVTEGSIFVDGVDIRKYDKQKLRSMISYAPQKSMVFQKTIYENLQVANSKLTREEAWEALRLAEAEKFVKDMPDGIDTVLAQNGMNVSGGQRQRLSLARMFSRKAQIYILDDSLSALDMQTDAALRGNIRTHLSDSMILIVAQRINTIMHADQILVMDRGRIVGQGRHEELLRTCKVYREIYATQCYDKREAEG